MQATATLLPKVPNTFLSEKHLCNLNEQSNHVHK